ncbi:PH domain-containing protein [Alkalihalobacillus trypoxylicola]|uniref:YdbS-like PH domain-containing protein n=1 Tax=Alkalihalobacillus trypoxylicola TaxID=519424 RepID=A0A162F2C7_9BACI|nr:PH domain-containing protein [Alkalihalobacillus trypoxylicola]KYG34334.1 hypothetical protein AZF04_14165 [Alkalihalobacillus trypoxylicola]
MFNSIQEPSQKISKDAIKIWRVTALITHTISILVLGVILFLQQRFEWFDWIFYVAIILIVIEVLYGIYAAFIRPMLLQKTWRYEVDQEYIQLKHGIFVKVHLIVPMVKVQYVNTNQGPLLRRYQLSTLTIGTTASTHEIPAIPEETAKELRMKIAMLANLSEAEDIEEEVSEEEVQHEQR